MSSRKSGVERTFYPNGQVEGEVTYSGGRVNGVTKRWHPNGILASEIPVKNDMVEGVAKFWDESGKLLGTYEIRNGSGIQKMWFPNGKLMGETPLLNGMITGRQLAFFESGDFCAETYYIRNEKVSKKQYLEAWKKDPSLPRYEEESDAKVGRRTRPKGPMSVQNETEEKDSLAEQLLAAPGSQEVLEWLCGGPAIRTLGEVPTREASIELAKEIYDLGASKVTAVKVDRYPDGQANAGKLVISLPKEKGARKKLFAWAADRAEEQGSDPEADTGQKHLFVMLD